MVARRLALTREIARACRALFVVLAACSCARGSDDAVSAGDSSADAALIAPPLGPPPVAPARNEFVGAASCQSCHAEQFGAWRTSTHGNAGGAPAGGAPSAGERTTTDRVRVIAPFDGTPIRFRDATVTPRQQHGVFSFVVQRPGERDTALIVDAVIGGGHMAGGGTQGFVTAHRDGTLRFLPFDWSRQNRTWFCNTGTRTEKGWLPITASMRLADCGDWPPTRVLGDEPRFSNCQSCHGSQVDVAFDSTAKHWVTNSNGFAINCESCHGPAARHVQLMRAGGPPSTDIGLVALATLNKEQSVASCMSCHALKDRLVSGWRPGAKLAHFYAVRLSQVGDRPLTPDGRTRTFAYQEGHLASDCYRNGGMTCTSCHDPHSQHYRTVNGLPIPGRTDDRQCTSCHASKAADIPAHTKHRANSPGSKCTSCHMTYQQQRELGESIRYARSDHSISIPRPTLDSALSITSACRSCHASTSDAQHSAQASRWWGDIKPHEVGVAGILAAHSLADIDSATPLLLQPDSRNATAQVAGLSRWLERFALPNMRIVPHSLDQRLRALSMSADPDVQALALAVLHYVRGDDPETRRFLQQQLTRVRDTNSAVGDADRDALRRRWAMVLGGIGDVARGANDATRAVTAYRQALAVTPGEPVLLVNLGLALAQSGEWSAAVHAYQQSLRVNTQQPLAQVNLGIALERLGNRVDATGAFERAIALDPTSPLGYMNLGTGALREGKAAEAIPFFEQALAREPGLAVGHFQLALALLKDGRLAQSAAAVRRSLALDTNNAEAVKLAAALRAALHPPK